MYLLALHAVFTIDAVFTIESFGWVDSGLQEYRAYDESSNNAELILMHGFVGST